MSVDINKSLLLHVLLIFGLGCGTDGSDPPNHEAAVSINTSAQDSVQIVKNQIDSCLIVYTATNSKFEFANYCDTGHVFYFNESIQHAYNVSQRFYVGRWKGALEQVKSNSQLNKYVISIPELTVEDVSCNLRITRLHANGDSTTLIDTLTYVSPVVAYFNDINKESVDSLLVRVKFKHEVLELEMPEMSANWVIVLPESKEP